MQVSKAWMANFALFACSVAVGLLLFEIGLRVFSPVELRIRGDRIDLPRMKTIVMDGSAFPKFEAEIVQSRNALGFRGPNPPNAFDRALTLIAIGGSTTEGYYLSDGKTWPEQLAVHLSSRFENIWVNNAGMDGQTTFGHLKILEQHVVALRPKVILINAGINDRGVAQLTLYDQNVKSAVIPSSTRERLAWQLGRSSELFALGMNMVRAFHAQQGNLGHGDIDFTTIGRVELPSAVAEELRRRHAQYLAGFAHRLRELIGIARAHGITPVLVTQTALWGRGIDPTTGRELGTLASEGGVAVDPQSTVTLNAGVSWEILELYNDVVRQAGLETGAFVVDLARRMPKDSRFFYDWVHFTNDGAATAAHLIAEDLCPYLAKRFPDHAKNPCP